MILSTLFIIKQVRYNQLTKNVHLISVEDAPGQNSGNENPQEDPLGTPDISFEDTEIEDNEIEEEPSVS